jgi:hypothetical protein
MNGSCDFQSRLLEKKLNAMLMNGSCDFQCRLLEKKLNAVLMNAKKTSPAFHCKWLVGSGRDTVSNRRKNNYVGLGQNTN